jgi:YggT family protein
MLLLLFRFPNPPQALVTPLATVCDPYLNLFRGIIPPLGGTIDLSPILAFVVLDVREL